MISNLSRSQQRDDAILRQLRANSSCTLSARSPRAEAADEPVDAISVRVLDAPQLKGSLCSLLLFSARWLFACLQMLWALEHRLVCEPCDTMRSCRFLEH